MVHKPIIHMHEIREGIAFDVSLYRPIPYPAFVQKTCLSLELT